MSAKSANSKWSYHLVSHMVLRKLGTFLGEVMEDEDGKLIDRSNEPNPKLISAKMAARMTLIQEYKPKEIVGSIPWYNAERRKDSKLPPITQASLHRIGPMTGASGITTNLYRITLKHGSKTKIKRIQPLLIEQELFATVFADEILAALKNDAKKLASKINETYYSPPEHRVREILNDWEAKLQQEILMDATVVAGEVPAPLVASPAPSADLPAMAEDRGVTFTQMMDVNREAGIRSDGLVENISRLVSVK
jgi:hypothetical protein